ncbi:hypothetical protein R2R70_02345 [Cobetia sp. SIMBA_158]|uniref:hypothetical protein n=1 Tax=Cobetia sp. SIMBA_158 TaxID=3081617 RepID=UPI00397F695D
MARHHSVATVIDKNKIASLEAFIPMLEIEVIDHKTGNLVETLRICRNGNHDITYQGKLYATTDFNLTYKTEIDQPGEVSLSFFDRTGVITRYMQIYRGGVGFGVTLFFVNTGNMSQPPEFKERYSVRTASAKSSDYTVSFTLGMENPLAMRIPRRTQRKDRCQWRYKGDQCRYSGSLPSCDYSLQGANGCAVHNNQANFGAFPGINSQ